MTRALSNPRETGQLLSRASRPQNVLYSGVIAGFTAYCGGGSIGTVAGLYLLIVLMYGAAAVYNDVHDAATDALNHRHDIVIIEAPLRRAFLAVCAGVITLLQLIFVQPATLYLSLGYIALIVAYSHPKTRIMARGLWASLLLCICYGVLPFLLGAAQGTMFTLSQCAMLSLLQAGLLLPLVLAKDYKDIAGDAATGKRTPLVRYGAGVIRWGSVAVAAVTIALYGGLAMHVAIPAWFYIPCSAAYLLLVHRLHYQHGMVSNREKKILTAVLLLISLSLLASAALKTI